MIVYTCITDSAVLEALACREALALAVDLVWDSHFMVASDCKQVVADIVEGTLGKYGAVVSEIKGRASNFLGSEFVYEGRSSNFEAHDLARQGLSLEGGRHMWLSIGMI
jgi:hypothetical protein